MLKSHLNNRIKIMEKCSSWEEAIHAVAQDLLKQNCIEERYIKAMIANVRNLGPYIVLMPGFAMPHSRPEDGALEDALSLLILEQAVVFPENKEVWCLLCLSATSSDKHIDMIENIIDLLSDDKKMEQIRTAKTIHEVSNLL